jgi:hypothetical protein
VVRAVSGSFLLGNRALEFSRDRVAPGLAVAFPFTDRTAGSTTAINVYVDSHNRARDLIAGLYSDLNGQPGARLTSGSISTPKAGAWNTVPVRSAALKAGSTYWLAVLGTGVLWTSAT